MGDRIFINIKTGVEVKACCKEGLRRKLKTSKRKATDLWTDKTAAFDDSYIEKRYGEDDAIR